jgi:hypothetical protein
MGVTAIVSALRKFFAHQKRNPLLSLLPSVQDDGPPSGLGDVHYPPGGSPSNSLMAIIARAGEVTAPLMG